MKGTKLYMSALGLLLAACLSACSGPGKEDGGPRVFQIGFTTAAVEDAPYYVFASSFARLVDERSGGAIRIDIMGGGQLGQEGEMFTGMQIGTTDMAVMTNAYASGYIPASGLFDLPFIFKDSEQASEILDGPIGQSILKEYDHYNVKALAWGEGGFRHLVTSDKKVVRPEDFKGLKIRCMETESYIATYKALGTNAVPMAWSETITGLQQGTIDGLDIPVSVIYSNGFPDIAKYLNMTGHFYSPLIICMSMEAYNSLPADQQELLIQAAADAGRITRENNARVEGVMLDEMAAQGMEIVRDIDLPAFQAVLGSFYTDRAEQIGGTYVDDLLTALGKQGV